MQNSKQTEKSSGLTQDAEAATLHHCVSQKNPLHLYLYFQIYTHALWGSDNLGVKT